MFTRSGTRRAGMLTGLAALAACLTACSPRDDGAAARVEPAPAQAAPASPSPTPPAASAAQETAVKTPEKIVRTDAEWRSILTPEQYHILRQKGTERAFTGKYWNVDTKGVYRCAGCGADLFSSDAKFDSHCGWPSFDKALAKGTVEEHVDTTHGMVRTEITCARCGGHLGHVFDDGPTDTGLRYCINSASIALQADGSKPKADIAGGSSPATPDVKKP